MADRNGHGHKKKNVIKSGKDPGCQLPTQVQDLCFAVISAKSYRPDETRDFIPVNTTNPTSIRCCYYVYSVLV